VREPLGSGARLVVRAGRAAATPGEPPAGARWLRRYSRQVVLPEIGEAGQRRLAASRVLVAGRGAAFASASLYLAAAGVGVLRLHDPSPVADDEAGRWPFDDGPSASPRRDEALGRALRHATHDPTDGTGTDASAVRTPVVGGSAPSDGLLLAGAEPGTSGRLLAEAASHGTPAVVAGEAPDASLALANGALAADALLRRLLDDAPRGTLAVDGAGSPYLSRFASSKTPA
jgi:hypothetical protein